MHKTEHKKKLRALNRSIRIKLRHSLSNPDFIAQASFPLRYSLYVEASGISFVWGLLYR